MSLAEARAPGGSAAHAAPIMFVHDSMGTFSGGDLAFFNGEFYRANASSQLVHVDLLNLVNTSVIGNFGFANVFSLATGDNNIHSGVGGTQIFTVNVTPPPAR